MPLLCAMIPRGKQCICCEAAAVLIRGSLVTDR